MSGRHCICPASGPNPWIMWGRKKTIVRQHAAYLEVDNVGHGLFVVQMLDVFPRLRLRSADEVPCHLVVVEPPFGMVFVWVAVLPSHLPMCIPGVITTVSTVLTLFQGRLRAATRHSYVSRWCGTAAEQAGVNAYNGEEAAHELMLLLYSSAFCAASAVRAACKGCIILRRLPGLLMLRA